MITQYPHTVIVKFRNSGSLGTLGELEWRHSQELTLENLLEDHSLGMCDGGESGAGIMTIWLLTNDIPRAVSVILEYLTDNELIGFAQIASHPRGNYQLNIHWPKGQKEFSLWGW